MAQSTTYTHAHRALLQSFLSRTTHTTTTLRPALASILSIHEQRQLLENDITDPDITSHIAVINASISQYDLEIRQQQTQHDHQTNYADDDDEVPNDDRRRRVRVFALVNTTSDPIAQLATLRTPDEIAYLLRVLDCMFETQNSPTGRGGREIMAVGQMQALQLYKATPQSAQRRSSGFVNGNSNNPEQAAAGKSLTMGEAEKVLNGLVDEGWLETVAAPAERSSRYYILSPRALMELKGWLVETYNEPPSESAPPSEDEASDFEAERARTRGVERIKKCAACQEIVVSGQRCGERKCGGRLHDACTGSFWRSQRGERTCPQCRREWSGVDFVGVRAVPGAGRSSMVNGHRASGAPGSSRDARRSSGMSRAETVEVDDDENESDWLTGGKL